MTFPITKLWTRIPGTGYPTWDPYQPLTYVMGSYTLVARYRNTWSHKGRYTRIVFGYDLVGPGINQLEHGHTLGTAKQRVLALLRKK